MPARLTASLPVEQKLHAPLRRAHLFKRRSVAMLACLLLIVPAVLAWRVWEQSARRLDEERWLELSRDVVPFEKRLRAPLVRSGLRLQQATRSVRALARFRDSYFAATDGGLVELSQKGDALRRYTVLDGLPESDLVSLAAYRARLYVGTRNRGLLAFDGEGFESYLWPDRAPQAVSALLEDEGKLLIGTFAGGLLEFDGARFREIKGGGSRQRLNKITCLARYGPRLYVGTFDEGLWISEAGRWSHYAGADGLQSNRIVGVVERGADVFVASDFALAVAPAGSLTRDENDAGKFRRVAMLPALNSLALLGTTLLAAQDNGDISVLDASKPAELPRVKDVVRTQQSAEQTDTHLISLDGELWLLSNDGLRRARRGAATVTASLAFDDFGKLRETNAPASNLVSALAHDGEGNLWAGSFRNGIDIFNAAGRKLAHLDAAREINALVFDKETGAMLAATSEGVLRFDAARRVERLTTGEGLASDSVLHLALEQKTRTNLPTSLKATPERASQLYVATSRGLSFGTQGRLRTLTTVQGLPSNSVYAVQPVSDDTAYAGTLGGLAQIVGGRVVRVFKETNSNLKHNWVTALCRTNDALFVGTYGGGVFELMPSGELRSFATETGKAFVNPNAMWCDDERVYAGTLEGALVFELRAQKWTRLKDELPAPVVLSIEGRDGLIYIGTTGGITRLEQSFWRQPLEGE